MRPSDAAGGSFEALLTGLRARRTRRRLVRCVLHLDFMTGGPPRFIVYMHTEPVYKGRILEAISREEYALIVGTKDLPQGSYIASNAMGAKVRVSKDTEGWWR
jgi:hypothetical protein